MRPFYTEPPTTLDEYVRRMREFYEKAPKAICPKYTFGPKGESIAIPNNDTMTEIAKIQAIPDVFHKIIYPLWDFLVRINKWEKQELLNQLRIFADEIGIKFKQLTWIMRIVLEGQSIAPDLFDFMEIVGKNRCLHYLTFFMDEFNE